MERFRYYTEVNRKGDNMKTATIAVLVFSLILFIGLGDETTKQIIWYWVALMGLLMLINAVLDIKASKKMKLYDKAHTN